MEFWEIENECPDLSRDEEASSCSICGHPEGVIFKLDRFPLNGVAKDIFVCQGCAPEFIDQYKKSEEEFGEWFIRACNMLESDD